MKIRWILILASFICALSNTGFAINNSLESHNLRVQLASDKPGDKTIVSKVVGRTNITAKELKKILTLCSKMFRLEYYKAEIENALENEPTLLCHLLVKEQEIIGSVIIQRRSDSFNTGEAFLIAIVVDFEFQGKGFGKRLWYESMKTIVKAGYRSFYLESNNEKIIKWLIEMEEDEQIRLEEEIDNDDYLLNGYRAIFTEAFQMSCMESEELKFTEKRKSI